MKRNEVRVFYNTDEMQEDFTAFSRVADKVFSRDMCAELNDWKIRWKLADKCSDITSQIAGMSFNRIRVDMRATTEQMMYLQSRLRCRYFEVEPMQVFYKSIVINTDNY